jgi:hypothetical protein
LIALGRLPDDDAAPFAQMSLRWTRSVLGDDARQFLHDLPLIAAEGGIILSHGSLDSPSEYAWRPPHYVAQLDRLRELYPSAETLVLGHLHEPVAWGPSGPLPVRPTPVPITAARPRLLNPGSVGHTRELRARARFLVLDLNAATVAFHAVRYDAKACRRALRERGLPPASCHDSPLRPRRIAGAMRRAAARLVP